MHAWIKYYYSPQGNLILGGTFHEGHSIKCAWTLSKKFPGTVQTDTDDLKVIKLQTGYTEIFQRTKLEVTC